MLVIFFEQLFQNKSFCIKPFETFGEYYHNLVSRCGESLSLLRSTPLSISSMSSFFTRNLSPLIYSLSFYLFFYLFFHFLLGHFLSLFDFLTNSFFCYINSTIPSFEGFLSPVFHIYFHLVR